MRTVPYTIDGSEIPADAPGAMLTAEQAQEIADTAEAFRELVMHLHYSATGRDVTLTGANCPPGKLAFVFGDNTADVEQRIADGETPEVTHTYPSDGVFTAQLWHENGDRAWLEVSVNWPPPFPETPGEESA